MRRARRRFDTCHAGRCRVTCRQSSCHRGMRRPWILRLHSQTSTMQEEEEEQREEEEDEVVVVVLVVVVVDDEDKERRTFIHSQGRGE